MSHKIKLTQVQSPAGKNMTQQHLRLFLKLLLLFSLCQTRALSCYDNYLFAPVPFILLNKQEPYRSSLFRAGVLKTKQNKTKQ